MSTPKKIGEVLARCTRWMARGRRQTVYVACQWCGQSVPVTLTGYTHPTKRVVADQLSFADLHAHIWKHIEWWRDA